MSVDFLRELVPSSQIVIRPDHPLLLRAPDALMGAHDNLCAIFEPHSIEIQNPAHLVTRLISARLALPRFVRTVLILKKGQESRFSLFEHHFGLLTDKSDPHLRQFLGSAQDFGHSRSMDPEIQARAGKAFDQSMEIANFAYRMDRISKISGRDVRSIVAEPPKRGRVTMGPFQYDPRNRVSVEGVEASVLSGRTRSSLTRQLNAALTAYLLETYQLDRGVPYLKKGESLAQLAIAVDAREIFNIRSKEVYAAAFSGLALISTVDPDVVLETASSYRTSLRGSEDAGGQ
jgi:hypothetical protein